MQAKPEVTDESRWWNLMWNTRLGIRYHLYAQSVYQKVAKFITIFTLAASSAAFTVVLNKNETLALTFTLIAAFLQIVDLVVDTKSKATLHSTLRQKYLQLEVLLQEHDQLTKEGAHTFNQTKASIELEEPPLIKSLMTYCHNEQARVDLGENSTHQVPIGRWTRLKIWLLPF
ncbi:hypothetical protein WKW58_03305 [Vibrio alginolyticus]|uniref:hypothetical protein n=1 Tax=Vibrio TaxID=662 RepID=UPI001CDD268A|nr:MULTISPECIES: hypothetical protein [Vibrio]MCA2484861.1 hypothetical protein [Vibrio alginolyticus]MDW2281167.1 hypothetical protein [Vibrio sp. 1402]